MFCSTIIPTIGRPSLSRAVESVLNQEFFEEESEVIVINDSGHGLPEGSWQTSKRVQVVETQRRERSVARNVGASIAKGKYLHFLDDDDYLAPGALRSFWELSRDSSAKWLYGITQLVDRRGTPLIRLCHGLNGNCLIQTVAGEWIPLQASFIDAETFFGVGGFDQTIAGPEDIDLLRRVSIADELVEIKKTVAVVAVGDKESTTNYEKHPSMARRARENVLGFNGVFLRMKSSAVGSGFWKGKLCRIYLTSMIWNLGHARFCTAVSRLMLALASFASAGFEILTPEFWLGLGRSYQSPAFGSENSPQKLTQGERT